MIEMETEFPKYFCMAPWVHMSIWQTGDAYPCCIYDWQTPIGNINQQGIYQTWNSQKMKQLRLEMLRNIPAQGCTKCFDYEKKGILSYRHKMNKDYKHHFDLVKSTDETGKVEKLNIAYFDVRFSNLCNMKCRSCGAHFSSKWGEDLYGSPKIIEIEYENLWEEIDLLLPNVEEIYFTGGESLFMPQHYKLLDKLIQKKLFPKLTYNSNASRLNLKNNHVADYWKYFTDIEFYISFDQIYDKAEFARHGQQWNIIYKNLMYIKNNLKHVKLRPNPTISVLNILDLADIVKFCFDEKISYKYQMNMNNLLITPEYLSCTILPKRLKQLAEERIIFFIEELKSYDIEKNNLEKLKYSFLKVIEFMYSADNTHMIPIFKKEMQSLDKKRGENFVKTYPEMTELYD